MVWVVSRFCSLRGQRRIQHSFPSAKLYKRNDMLVAHPKGGRYTARSSPEVVIRELYDNICKEGERWSRYMKPVREREITYVGNTRLSSNLVSEPLKGLPLGSGLGDSAELPHHLRPQRLGGESHGAPVSRRHVDDMPGGPSLERVRLRAFRHTRPLRATLGSFVAGIERKHA